jgi:hypothetical protein
MPWDRKIFGRGQLPVLRRAGNGVGDCAEEKSVGQLIVAQFLACALGRFSRRSFTAPEDTASFRMTPRGAGCATHQKLRVPRWCCVHSSQPVARVRPLLDLLCRFPCGCSACDLRLGSGLTANRTNLLNASELYPAFNWASRSPRPALCYRPLLAFPRHFAM